MYKEENHVMWLNNLNGIPFKLRRQSFCPRCYVVSKSVLTESGRMLFKENGSVNEKTYSMFLWCRASKIMLQNATFLDYQLCVKQYG